MNLQSGTLSNTGTIIGGAGGYGGYSRGAVGLLASGGVVLNSGIIQGASGKYFSNGGEGGAVSYSGAGVDLQGATLTNTGTIIGGAGASLNGSYLGAGNLGAVVRGGGLIDSGTISGGAGSSPAESVAFGSVAGTLVVEAGAVFNGLVVANTAAADVLVLGGTAAGTLSGLGSEFSNFPTVQVAAGADWRLSGHNALPSGTKLQDLGTLTVGGTLNDAGTLMIGPAGVLETGNTSGTVRAGSITMIGGALTDTAAGKIVIGERPGTLTAGTLTIRPEASFSGYGTITAPAVSVAGSLIANGGTLAIDSGSIAGHGALAIDVNAIASVSDSLSVAHVVFAGEDAFLYLAKPAEVISTFQGFSTGDGVDLEKLVANKLTYSGGTLTLLNGSQVVDALKFAGSYTAADFRLQNDGNGGTFIFYAGSQAHEFGGSVIPDFSIAGVLREEAVTGALVHVAADEAARPAWLPGLWGHSFI